MKKVDLKKAKTIIPTYIPKKANDLPMFFENKPYQGASGRLYPIPYSDGITDEKKDVEYEVYTLENEYIKTQVVPELGGKILRGYDKTTDYDFIYYNEVVKPALVGIAGSWISGGIEFNWPQHHRPTTFMPLEAVVEETSTGKTVWTGEVEPMNRMKGMAGITVDNGRSYIKAKIRVYNRTDVPQIFMWWANLAVPVNDDYRTVFPPDCEWVNDHDRRAVLEWPVAKGVYKTARPYDFGEGTDLSWYSAVKVPSSYLISQDQSDMDFIAGYDTGIDKGIATVANHHISPGKKMWHWGIGDFGDMWCSNLTDENGPYIELMTGVYTDNQPDFTWIAPYETREFEQYWYPVYKIGNVVNATIDAAMNLEQRGDEVFVGFNATGVFKNATVEIKNKNGVMLSEKIDIDPKTPYLKTIALDGTDFMDVTATLTSDDGKVLVSYTPYVRGQKQPIEPRLPVKRPSEIETVEELYINGYHLEQYKQHNYRAEDYYLEGLKRDPGDIRCNTSMARLAIKNGKFEECITYASKAIERLTMRNQHPTDTESFYLKGLAEKYLGKLEEAYKDLYKAGWNYTHRSAAFYQLALIDCINGDFEAAILKAEESLGLNKGHTKAGNLITAINRKLGRTTAAKKNADLMIKDDLLDMWAATEKAFLTGDWSKVNEVFGGKGENYLDVARDYMEAGMYDYAYEVLSHNENEYPLCGYYMAYCNKMLGLDYKDVLYVAEHMDTGYCFPSNPADIKILKFAVEEDNTAGNAAYYLGSLYYDRFRYEEAIEAFELSVSKAPAHKKSWRNLSIAYFDKRGDAKKAVVAMENALKFKSDDPRLLLEYEQLLKNIDRTPDERLAVYEKYPELLSERDDCYLDRIVLWCLKGEYERAIQSAKAKRFHIYEGGEGKLTKQHAWMHVLYGNQLTAEGKLTEAKKIYEDGINMPKSYGEAKTFFNQESHIHYYLGKLYAKLGDKESERKAYEEAAIYKAAVSELSLFRALALKELGQMAEAQKVLEEMLSVGEDKIRNKDLRSYYGVGSPSPMPFEYDVEKENVRDGSILLAYAYLGMGEIEKSKKAIDLAREKDVYDFRIYAYDQIIGTIIK